jgi:hypothetical protein
MLYYEKLRRDNFTGTPAGERVFKDPDAFVARMRELSQEERLSEITYLIALLVEKV